MIDHISNNARNEINVAKVGNHSVRNAPSTATLATPTSVFA